MLNNQNTCDQSEQNRVESIRNRKDWGLVKSFDEGAVETKSLHQSVPVLGGMKQRLTNDETQISCSLC